MFYYDLCIGEIMIYELSSEFESQDVRLILEYIAESLSEAEYKTPEELLDEILTSASKKMAACKSAMKMGRDDNIKHLEWLVEKIMKNRIMYCPHGRPFYHEVSKNTLNKLFGR